MYFRRYWPYPVVATKPIKVLVKDIYIHILSLKLGFYRRKRLCLYRKSRDIRFKFHLELIAGCDVAELQHERLDADALQLDVCDVAEMQHMWLDVLPLYDTDAADMQHV